MTKRPVVHKRFLVAVNHFALPVNTNAQKGYETPRMPFSVERETQGHARNWTGGPFENIT